MINQAKAKKALAMVATAGMLVSPLALAQNPQGGGPPQRGGLAGLSQATGLSVPVLAGIGTITVIAVAVAIADSGDGSSPTGTP
ncbi:MAG: hypothetical protein U5L98_07780 [Halomonas sp.]|uniref:hypothetical protein n=1 Tax=Halomonas sp. TaxID=1486246 RepID=UPI002ACDB78B|nr:hypothetical protein [Halomonas sp.]MDZ7852538.1 hypothetical protein [Halomonas sp.]